MHRPSPLRVFLALFCLPLVAGAETFDLLLPPDFEALGVAQAPAGDVIVAGTRELGNDEYAAVVMRLDRDGSTVWARELNIHDGSRLRAMHARAGQFIALAGGHQLVSASMPHDGVGWAAALDFDGDVAWVRTFGSSLEPAAVDSIVVDKSGRVAVGGRSYHSADPQTGDTGGRLSWWSWDSTGSPEASEGISHAEANPEHGFNYANGTVIALTEGTALAAQYKAICCFRMLVLGRWSGASFSSQSESIFDGFGTTVIGGAETPTGALMIVGVSGSSAQFRLFDSDSQLLTEVHWVGLYQTRAFNSDQWPALVGGAQLLTGEFAPVIATVDEFGQPLDAVILVGSGITTSVTRTTDGGVVALIDTDRLVKVDSNLAGHGACASLSQPTSFQVQPAFFEPAGPADPSLPVPYGPAETAVEATTAVTVANRCFDSAPAVGAVGGQLGQTLAFQHKFPSLPGGTGITLLSASRSLGAAPFPVPSPLALQVELLPDELTVSLLQSAPASVAALDIDGVGMTAPIPVPADPALAGLTLEFASLGTSFLGTFEQVTATGTLELQ